MTAGVRAPDHLVARIAADQPEQGWSLLCNGVVLFDDGGEVPPAGPAARVAQVSTIEQDPVGKTQQAKENRTYVRNLLWERQSVQDDDRRVCITAYRPGH